MMTPPVSPTVSRLIREFLAAVERVAITRSHELARSYSAAVGTDGRAPARAARSRRAHGGAPARGEHLCPVPGCKNAADAALGMVCSEHEEVPKAVIAKYLAERRGDFSHLVI
jgi:hypothetical protein